MSSPEFYRSIDFFPVIKDDACAICLACVRACALGVISYSSDGGFSVRKRTCRNCRSCVEACRFNAVSITAELGGSSAGFLKKDQRIKI